MADEEISKTKESDEMSIFKRAQHDDTEIHLGLNQTAKQTLPWRERTDAPGTGSHERPFSDADRRDREVIEQWARTSSENQALRRENADLNGECNALHREVSRLQAKVDALELDNRTIRCFAQSLKTRIHAVAEACDKAIAESLTEAAEEAKKEPPQDDPVPASVTESWASQAEG